MKILKEAKEQLPVSFLTDFISKGWEEVGYLKADIEAIKEAYKGTKKIEELIQALVDAYLVCIGQLEAHIHDNNYIEYPEESGLGLKEELEIKISEDKLEITTEENTPVEVDEEGDKIVISLEELEEESEEMSEKEPTIEDNEAEIEEEPKKGETFEYFVDFEDPDMSEPRLTDDDLYGVKEADADIRMRSFTD